MTKNRKIKCKCICHDWNWKSGAPSVIPACECSDCVPNVEIKEQSTPEPSEEWVDRFRKECGELWEYHSVVGSYTQSQEEVESFIHTLLTQREKKLRERIGMLRQWLNEDRIKDAKYFVTNESIERWLDIPLSEVGEKGGGKHDK